ncbi:MAG: helix-turn-helix transcriptional regulator [Clostridia bacterium]|nr:helix-turn-helix transcriptional regulator [Clostridia bacterium]
MRYRIRDLREDNDRSQKELADLLGVTQAQYSNIENQKSDITGEKIITLCELYNVSADYILGLIKEPKTLK